MGGVNLGDVWRHSQITGPGLTAGLVPFHKLSQWLTYSLIEPMLVAGITVTGLDELWLDGMKVYVRYPLCRFAWQA